MTPFGAVLLVIEAIPREMLRNPTASGSDFRLVADKLDHAARQVRTLAECQPEPAPMRRIPTIGRARA